MRISSVANKNVTLTVSDRDFKDFTKDLNVGQNLNGKVITILDSNKYLVNFKGFNIVSESYNPLLIGQQINGKVLEVFPKVVLKLFENSQIFIEDLVNSENFNVLLDNLSLEPTFNKLVNKLENALKNFSPEKKQIIKDFILVLNSFKLYSGKNTDLNKQLIKFLQNNNFVYLEEKIIKFRKSLFENINSEEIKLKKFLIDEIINELINNIKSQVYLTDKIKNSEFFAYLQLPIFFNEDFRDFELTLFIPKKVENKKNKLKLILVLNLKNLGKVKIVISIAEKNMDLNIFTYNNKAKFIFENNSNLFKDFLAQYSYKLNNFKIICVEDIENGKNFKIMNMHQLNSLDILV